MVDSEHHWWLCYICGQSVVVVIISTQLSVKGAEAQGDGIGSRSGFMPPSGQSPSYPDPNSPST